jgi:hypothetical protein
VRKYNCKKAFWVLGVGCGSYIWRGSGWARSIERIPLADWSEFLGLASLGAIHCAGTGLDYLDWEYTTHSLSYSTRIIYACEPGVMFWEKGDIFPTQASHVTEPTPPITWKSLSLRSNELEISKVFVAHRIPSIVTRS